jgi:ribosomal protein S18 acetylase RimI-like enzyme
MKRASEFKAKSMTNDADYFITEVDIQSTDLAQEILTVQRAAYQLESELIDYPALPPLYEEIADLQHSGEHFLVCYQNEMIIGALSYLETADLLDICRLVVSPSQLRRGIAGRLLAALEAKRVAQPLIIVSTAARNTPAVRLYEKYGYQIVRRRQLPDGLKLVQLEKRFRS